MRVHRIEDRLAIVPIDFYESPKEVLLERGDHLVRRTWEAKANARSSSSRTSEPKAKSPRLERRQTSSKNRSSKGSGQEKIYSSKTYHSKAFSNVDLANERNLAAESSKKNSSYSKGKSPSTKKSVPSATVTSQSTERGTEGNRGKSTGSAKNKQSTQGVVSISRSKQMLHRVDKGESIECLNLECSRMLHNASGYKCSKKCNFDTLKFLRNRLNQSSENEYPRSYTNVSARYKKPEYTEK